MSRCQALIENNQRQCQRHATHQTLCYQHHQMYQSGGYVVDLDPNAVKIYIMTFNQGQMDKNNRTEAENAIKANFITCNIHSYDIVVLNLQESPRFDDTMKSIFNQYLTTNMIKPKQTTKFTEYFDLQFEDTQEQGTLGKMKMYIWTRRLPNEKNMLLFQHKINQHCALAKGFIGAVIYDKVRRKKFGFINTHLPSQPKHPEKRDKCLIKAIQSMPETDILLVSGDLNYRTETKTPNQNDKAQIQTASCQTISKQCLTSDKATCKILKNDDQLLSRLNHELKSTHLQELPIHFCPTCRFQEKSCHSSSSQVNQSRTYHDKRYPSWCDRILYVEMGLNVSQPVYDSLPISCLSDHNAVILTAYI